MTIYSIRSALPMSNLVSIPFGYAKVDEFVSSTLDFILRNPLAAGVDPGLASTRQRVDENEFWVRAGEPFDRQAATREMVAKFEQEGGRVLGIFWFKRRLTNVRVPVDWQVPGIIADNPVWRAVFGGRDRFVIPFSGETVTVDAYRVKIVHDPIGIAFGVAIVLVAIAGLLFIYGVRNLNSINVDIREFIETAAEGISEVVKAPFAGATQILLLFVVGGAIFSFAVFFAGRAAGAKEVAPPSAPVIPGLAAPQVTVGPSSARIQTGIRPGGRRRG